MIINHQVLTIALLIGAVWVAVVAGLNLKGTALDIFKALATPVALILLLVAMIALIQ